MKKIIYLSYISILEERLLLNKPLIQVLLGPRQVGKTTTILKLINDKYKTASLYCSADDLFNPNADWLISKWQQAYHENKILFIDEIQKINNWSQVIKSLYDKSKKENKSIKCVLLGSSSLQIQKGLSESLTGRYQLLRAHHWNFTESQLAYGITMNQFLKFGGYPGSYEFIETDSWYDYVKNSIVLTVIEKDILQFHTVKTPALFKQAFELLISYPAQEISYTKLLGQLQDRGNVELIKYYLSLYEGAYLIKVLEKFSNKPVLRKSSSPKILPLAPCLPYLQIRSDYSPEEQGRIFETLVGIALVRTGEDLYYWREGKYEVDFILKAGRQIYAIEAKSGKQVKRSGLERFKEKFPSAKLLIITPDNYLAFEADPILFIEKIST